MDLDDRALDRRRGTGGLRRHRRRRCRADGREHRDHRPKDQVGIQVLETVTIKTDGVPYLAFLPFPTENCNLCLGRTTKGEQPTCVKHCMANVIQHGPVDELAEKMDKPRMVLYSIK